MRINPIKLCLLSMSVLMLAGCKPMSEASWYRQLFGQGTALVDGGFTPSDHWQGQWRIVNIWAEWCKPCWQEIPELNEFNASHSNSNIKLLGYNFDELTLEELQSLKAKMSIEFPVLRSWPKEWLIPDVKGLPATVIIAPDNTSIKLLWGPQTVAKLTREIDAAKAQYNEQNPK